MKITGSKEELLVLRRRIENSQDRATSSESADLDYNLELEDEWFAIHEKNAKRVEELEKKVEDLTAECSLAEKAVHGTVSWRNAWDEEADLTLPELNDLDEVISDYFNAKELLRRESLS